ncbi:MAG: hypothetical protein IKN16_12805 [Selenomonadaceae bacterium]|nr:hypothetical protein [Selenomonadaceae bacterium]
MDEKITLVTFTDPMMGLSYECEPIFRKLETHFDGKIEFHYVMSLLVRDVYELNIETLQELLVKHPLISHIELKEAFNFSDTAQIRNFIAPLVDSGEIKIIDAKRGYFIQKI